MSAAVTDLVNFDTKQREVLKNSTGAFDPAVQTIAPGFDAKLRNFHSIAREQVFFGLAQSEGVTTNSLDKINEAIANAKTSLAGIGSFVSSVVTTATETAEHVKKNEAVRNDTLSGVAPANSSGRVAYVSENTLDALKVWFNTKSTEAEAALSGTFAAATTQEDMTKWSEQAKDFGVTSEQYRHTLKAVGASLAPFTPLIDQNDKAPHNFNLTILKVKSMFEAAAVDLVQTLPHDEAMKKLEALKALSVEVAGIAGSDLAQGGNLTLNEMRLIYAGVRKKLDIVRNGAPKDTKSWTL